jgi:DNA-binding CsgD family transcriptional regulator
LGHRWLDTVERELRALGESDLGYRALLGAMDEVLRPRLKYAIGVWGTADPASLLLTSCTLTGGMALDPDRLEQLARIEYTTDDPGDMTAMYRDGRLATSLRTEVDDPSTVTRYREVTRPLGSFDELRLVFVLDGLPWGALIAHRGKEDGPFDADDLTATAALSATIAAAIRLAFLRDAARHPGGTTDPPGQLVVGPDRRIISSTEVADRWVEAIGGDAQLGFLLSTLGPRRGGDGHRAITLTTDTGPVTVHASSATGGDGDGATALVLERPRPIVLTHLIISAYGFTSREREVAEMVLRGSTTKQIARALGIRDYTVQDHLKAIFAKTDVSTRGDLSWTLYSRFYLPPVREDATPSPYGFYLDAG